MHKQLNLYVKATTYLIFIYALTVINQSKEYFHHINSFGFHIVAGRSNPPNEWWAAEAGTITAL